MRFPVVTALAAIISVAALTVVEGINVDVNKVLCLVNQKRQEYGKKPLALDPGLNQAALRHAKLQLSYGKLAHSLPDGSTAGSRIRSAVGGSKWKGIAENALSYETSEEEAVRRWVRSSGHLKNILGKYTHMGIAAAGSGRKSYWTQTFGNDGGDTVYPVCPNGNYPATAPPPAEYEDEDVYESSTGTQDEEVYNPSTGTQDEEVYDPSTGTQDDEVYDPSTGTQDEDVYNPSTGTQDEEVYDPSTGTQDDEDTYIPSNKDDDPYTSYVKTTTKSSKPKKVVKIVKVKKVKGKSSKKPESYTHVRYVPTYHK